jgi:cell division inhibitor SepF
LNSEHSYETYEPQPTWITRLKDRIWPSDEDGVESDGIEPEVRRRAALRLDTARQYRVSVRLKASVFNDARVAADGLKLGQQQIVNLEDATPQMAERILDFLSGVTYALDGAVEKIGDRVYLFAPANVHIEVDGGEQK